MRYCNFDVVDLIKCLCDCGTTKITLDGISRHEIVTPSLSAVYEKRKSIILPGIDLPHLELEFSLGVRRQSELHFTRSHTLS